MGLLRAPSALTLLRPCMGPKDTFEGSCALSTTLLLQLVEQAAEIPCYLGTGLVQDIEEALAGGACTEGCTLADFTSALVENSAAEPEVRPGVYVYDAVALRS